MNIERTIFSDCGQYRYTLYRGMQSLLLGSTKVLFCMLNPSLADDNRNDPTVKRVLGFAQRLDCSKLIVVNLFALISPDPVTLHSHADPVGPMNDQCIHLAALWADKIVVAWGTHGGLYNRADSVLELLKGHQLLCLGPTTKEGFPNHPLYLRRDVEFQVYREAA